MKSDTPNFMCASVVKSEEESEHFLNEITRLLLSAGYFRVRMPDLDVFDKIAGGLAWALKAAAVDVDVDIFFKEKPNIGEKIRISESIITGLKISKCPLQLQAYQIQGLDLPKLFPVIQWLVKRVLAVRNEFGDFQRAFAEFNFNNKYANLPFDVQIQQHRSSSQTNIEQMEHFFPPKRFYKRGDFDPSIPEIKQIETTLLEYGRIPSVIHSGSGAAPAGGSITQKQLEEEEMAKSKHTDDLKQTLKTMQTADEDGTVNMEAFSALSNNEILQKAKEMYQQQAAMLNVQPAYRSELVKEFENKKENLLARLNNVKQEGRRVNDEYEQISTELQNLTDQYNEAVEINEKYKDRIEECKDIISQSDHTEHILRAMALRDDTARYIGDFKEQCQKEKADWEQKIVALQTAHTNNDETSNADDRLDQTLSQYEAEWDRKQKQLAEVTREVLKLRTDYDQVPTIAELTQYDRRLNELSTLHMSKLNELKKVHQLYDSIEKSDNVLNQENKLFNSILSTFNQAVRDTQLQHSLLKQMDDISKQTTQEKNQLASELRKLESQLATQEEKHRKLLENQRRYFQAIKDYQEAYETLTRMKEELQ